MDETAARDYMGATRVEEQPVVATRELYKVARLEEQPIVAALGFVVAPSVLLWQS